MAQASRSNKTSPLTMAENNCVSVPHTMISESCTTQSVVKVGTLGEASMMTVSNTVTVSATLPAAVVYHTQAIESDAVANYEMQEAEQTSLLSFPENSAGISTQTLIETRCDDLHPAISSGDFGRVVKLKSERNLTDNEKYVLLKKHLSQLQATNFFAIV